ncbi:hypothetical protein C8R44DRAFT_881712 [Mycena epipterygia]|nr:hypothetical protein C8R44DRAFT_881712 [Mycena epipterygia]
MHKLLIISSALQLRDTTSSHIKSMQRNPDQCSLLRAEKQLERTGSCTLESVTHGKLRRKGVHVVDHKSIDKVEPFPEVTASVAAGGMHIRR